MMILFKLAVFEAWVLGVFLASWRTERTLDFAFGSQELLLLGFALLFALHNATHGLFRIVNKRGQDVNRIAIAIFVAVGAWAWLDTSAAAERATLFWALGPMALSLVLARIAWFWSHGQATESD